MSRPRTRVSRAATALLAAAALLPGLAGCRSRAEAQRTPPPPTVTVIAAEARDVPVVSTSNGTTRALQEVTVRARVRGFLQEQHFDEGSNVKKGDLLFVIEEKPFRVALSEAQAKQAEAQAALEKAEASKIREVAAAQLALSQAQLLLARLEEARQRNLRTRNANSPQDVDRAEADRAKWEAQVEADRASLEQARSDYDVNILTAKANLASTRAAVEDAEINLGYCRMVAPIDGRIGEARVKIGNLVGNAQDTDLASIQQLDPMGIDFQISSRYIPLATKLIARGLNNEIFIEGERTYPIPARTYFIDNRVDPTTSTVLVKSRVANPDHELLPGEYIQARTVIGEYKQTVVVPEQAVIQTQGGEQVYTVGKGDQVAIARVKALDTYRGLRVIESGLEPGQLVIVEGLQLVRPGIRVKVDAVSLERYERDEVSSIVGDAPASRELPPPAAPPGRPAAESPARPPAPPARAGTPATGAARPAESATPPGRSATPPAGG